ncbi:ABC transporter permease [Actinomadura hibisca]|uniref:ABC transporter permease n=1 Tax=Actinomadura hibisca TaxID=68565 RepID=UPI000834F53A|nr:ABC transporter permease [Actinomadura hibisca]
MTSRPRDGGLPGAVAAEWTKLWSLRSTWWTLAGAFALCGLMTSILATDTVHDNTNELTQDDPGVLVTSDLVVAAIDIVQFVVLGLAILTITGEYATGSIRTTLQAVPPRGRVLAAKAAVVTAVVFPLGVLLGLTGTAVASVLMGEWGRTTLAQTLGDSLAIGAYLALISVFMLGVGALLRSTAATLTLSFLLLMALPMLLTNAGVPLVRHVGDALPSAAGRYFMNGEDSPYAPAAGLAILVAWAVAATVAARTSMRRRDA